MLKAVRSPRLVANVALKLGQHVREQRRDIGRAHRLGVRHASELTFVDHKRSDTLFVLGSGSSINRLDEPQWSAIRAADSLGFNNWMVHEHVPSYYMLELVPASEGARHEANRDNVLHNLETCSSRYRGVPLLIVDTEERPFPIASLPAQLQEQVYVNTLFNVYGHDRAEVTQAVELLRSLGLFAPMKRYRTSLAKRASLFRIVHFAVVAGYRRIVLCGIDLNDTEYFFQTDPAAYEARGYRLDHVPMIQSGAVHRTNDAQVHELTISLLLDILRSSVLEPLGIGLYVIHESSALFPAIPKHGSGAA